MESSSKSLEPKIRENVQKDTKTFVISPPEEPKIPEPVKKRNLTQEQEQIQIQAPTRVIEIVQNDSSLLYIIVYFMLFFMTAFFVFCLVVSYQKVIDFY